VDPAAEDYYGYGPYVYVGNNPVRRIDPNGNDGWDVVIGAAAALIDNAAGGMTNVRSYAANYVNDAGDFNRGQNIGDAASIALGGAEIGGGQALSDGGKVTVAASLAAEIPSGGTSTVTLAGGAAAVAGGEVMKVHGVMMMGAGTLNSANQKGRLPENKGSESNSSSSQTSKETKTRQSQGADGATSKHIIEKDASGNTISKTHQVSSTEGKVIHQHQDYVSQTPQQGQKPTTRRFPDEWVEFPSINAK